MTIKKVLKLHSNPIETATSYEKAIEIISEEFCRKAIAVMQAEFRERFPDSSQVCLIPILRGGKDIGNILAEALPGASVNPMQMSYYLDDMTYLDEPACLSEPDINKIVVDGSTKAVVFIEAVVDIQGTIMASMNLINEKIDLSKRSTGADLSYPEYHTLALVSKTGDNPVAIPNLRAMFQVNERIWIHGWGCDNAGEGRDERRIMGILSPHAEDIPQRPYYEALFPLE